MSHASKHTPSLPVTIIAGLLAVLCVTSRQAAAQPIASGLQLSNPSALEFRVDGDAETDTEYRVELIRASDAPATAQPVKVWEGRASRNADGTVRVDLAPLISGVEDGEYVATLTISGTGPSTSKSAVVGPFTLFGHGVPPNAAAPAGAAGPTAEGGRERMWTRIAIAAAAALMVVPFLLR